MSQNLEERVRFLEHQVSLLTYQVQTRGQPAPQPTFVARPPMQSDWPGEQQPVAPIVEPPPLRPVLQSREMQSGRLLAIVGSIAVILGIAFLVTLGIEQGWIGETARVVIAAVGAGALAAGGALLYERKGKTQAALAMVATGIAGLYLSLTAATVLYGLVPKPAGLLLALCIGVAGTAVAVRVNRRTVAAVGIGGTLLAPLLGNSITAAGMGFLALASGAAAAVLVWRRWPWLMVAAAAVSLGQVALWVMSGPPDPRLIAVLTAFAGLNLAIALGYDWRTRGSAHPAALLLVPFGTLLLGALGYFGLPHGDGQVAGGVWLVALAVGHAVLAGAALIRRWGSAEIALLIFGAALLLGDVAFGVLAGGWVLAVGWAASATGFAIVAQRYSTRRELLELTVGGQLALAIGHVLLFEAPPGLLVGDGMSGSGSVSALVAVVVAAFASARLVAPERPVVREALDALSMLALAYATAVSLDGIALLIAWGGATLMLARAAALVADRAARWGSLGFLAFLAAHVMVFEAPLSALVYGVDDLLAAAFGLALFMVVAVMLWRDLPFGSKVRAVLAASVTVALVYLGSVSLVTAVDLRQQGQALLSAYWGVCGIAALWIGLRTRAPLIRLGGLGLLALATGKVFVFDLAALSSIYRIGSFIVLGLLLLTAAYVSQRAAGRESERPGPALVTP